MARQADVKSVTWTLTTDNSNPIVTDGYAMFGLITPATFEPTTVKFQIDDGAGNWIDLYDKTGTLVTVVVAASRATDLPGELANFPMFRMFQTAGGQPAATRTFKVWMRN